MWRTHNYNTIWFIIILNNEKREALGYLAKFSMSYCHWKPLDERERNQKICFGALQYHHNHVSLFKIFIFIFSNPLPHPNLLGPQNQCLFMLEWILTKIDLIWKIAFDWRLIWYFGVGMTSAQNSVLPQILRRGAKRLIGWKSKVLQHIQTSAA